ERGVEVDADVRVTDARARLEVAFPVDPAEEAREPPAEHALLPRDLRVVLEHGPRPRLRLDRGIERVDDLREGRLEERAGVGEERRVVGAESYVTHQLIEHGTEAHD